ncbi:hypothetical protein BJX99DRAFT_254032 [Aspergillus californicus]
MDSPVQPHEDVPNSPTPDDLAARVQPPLLHCLDEAISRDDFNLYNKIVPELFNRLLKAYQQERGSEDVITFENNVIDVLCLAKRGEHDYIFNDLLSRIFALPSRLREEVKRMGFEDATLSGDEAMIRALLTDGLSPFEAQVLVSGIAHTNNRDMLDTLINYITSNERESMFVRPEFIEYPARARTSRQRYRRGRRQRLRGNPVLLDWRLAIVETSLSICLVRSSRLFNPLLRVYLGVVKEGFWCQPFGKRASLLSGLAKMPESEIGMLFIHDVAPLMRWQVANRKIRTARYPSRRLEGLSGARVTLIKTWAVWLNEARGVFL